MRPTGKAIVEESNNLIQQREIEKQNLPSQQQEPQLKKLNRQLEEKLYELQELMKEILEDTERQQELEL